MSIQDDVKALREYLHAVMVIQENDNDPDLNGALTRILDDYEQTKKENERLTARVAELEKGLREARQRFDAIIAPESECLPMCWCDRCIAKIGREIIDEALRGAALTKGDA